MHPLVKARRELARRYPWAFSKRIWLVVCLNVAWLLVVGLMLISGMIPSPLSPIPKPAGSRWTRSLSFAELEKVPPFVAVVESTQVGERGPLIDNSTGLPARGAAATPYLLIHLVTDKGKRLAIYQENPTTNQVAFAHGLRVGERYSFPARVNGNQ